jgi:hypothetical protein
MSESSRVLKVNGSATFVVANAQHGGCAVSVEMIVQNLAELNGLKLVERHERMLPDSRRYLPPPAQQSAALSRRMRSEIVITFKKD